MTGIEELMVKDVMTRLVVTLRSQDTIDHAARQLLSNRISGAPVVEAGRLIGVLSESDLVKAFTTVRRNGVPATPYPLIFLLLRGAPHHEASYSSVADVMTKNVVTIGPGDSIWEAASRIDRYGIRRLPVVDGDEFLIGIVARSDLVRYMARSFEKKRAS